MQRRIPVHGISIAILAMGLGNSANAEATLFDFPFYFAAPRTAWGEARELKAGAELPGGAVVVDSEIAGLPEIPAGLRFVVLPDTPPNRTAACRMLSSKGLLEDGDVVLTFRPDWADTMAYPHIQMGISHSGFIHTRNGTAYNLDMPLDEEFNKAFNSELNSKHYLEAKAVHVLRHRDFHEADLKDFRQFIDEFLTDVPTIRKKGLLPFNSDYLTPRYAAYQITPAQSVDRFRTIALSPGSQDSPMKMYCSEFVWHMQSLNGKLHDNAPVIFPPADFVSLTGGEGMADGPLTVLTSAGAKLPPERKLELSAEIFTDTDAPQLSTGHKATAKQVKPLMDQLSVYYQMVLGNRNSTTINGVEVARDNYAGSMNASMPDNYSPTTFMLNSFLPAGHPDRKFDYLYTLVFVPNDDYRKALEIAKQERKSKP
ncbi:MAG: hypothetical protein ABIS50_11265 [Luteolibacter sp.]|uniref:hypothetical protein n=1 Tax=Luteolibacter sp. TaxID=1962973 RepID=UPI003264CCCD